VDALCGLMVVGSVAGCLGHAAVPECGSVIDPRLKHGGLQLARNDKAAAFGRMRAARQRHALPRMHQRVRPSNRFPRQRVLPGTPHCWGGKVRCTPLVPGEPGCLSTQAVYHPARDATMSGYRRLRAAPPSSPV
jgi:hypothetical protein